MAAASSLPAWSTLGGVAERMLPSRWPYPVTRAWALNGSTGRGVRVCVIDSGIEPDHPRVGALDGAMVAEVADDGRTRVVPDEAGDVAGHGTACAGIIRSLAPDCALHALRVLGPDATGTGAALMAGLAWAVTQGFDIINLSMSTRKRELVDALHEISDDAYFQRSLIVASAHNSAVASFPWRFASVLSVGCHEADDPLDFRYNPRPPAEFFARGVDVEVAWPGGGTSVTTGNSFAAAHMTGISALLLANHPGLTPFEVKSLLYLTASNVEGHAA